jgi:lysine/ornithine N-monooxygenase
MDTCAGGQKDAAVGSSAQAKKMQRWAAARLQIGAGERAWIPARKAKKIQRRAAVRAKKMQRRAEVWLQISVGKRAWIPAREAKKMQ